MYKNIIAIAVFLIAPPYLIQHLLFWSCSFILRFFFYKTFTNTQQVLPMQTGLYRYDEWMVPEINDENLMLTKLNAS